MPLETQTVEILFAGLSQKSDAKTLKAGDLVRAENVEYDKAGVLNKRRGFLRFQFSGASQIGAFGNSMETSAMRLAVHQDELLIFGVSWLWALGSRRSAIDGKAAVRRGRIAAGNTRVWTLATASGGTET